VFICVICGQPKVAKQQAARSAQIREIRVIREIRGQKTVAQATPPPAVHKNNQWKI
jgi:hypothetical protein